MYSSAVHDSKGVEVRFTLENTGGKVIEIVTARGSGSKASNEIGFKRGARSLPSPNERGVTERGEPIDSRQEI